MSKGITTIFTAFTSFSAGVVVGLLLAPKSGKENRKWIGDHTSDAKNWMGEKSHHLIEESEKRLEKISEGLKESIPDLYAATESVVLDEEDVA